MMKALRAAVPATLPVMAGYLFVGFAFGVLFGSTGQHPVLAVLMSVVVYAGSMQFFAVKIIKGGFSLLSVALLTLLINARHIFYGLPFLERFRAMGPKKPYMIFSLTDETFSLLCSAVPPRDVDGSTFMFCIALLNQFYWVAGTAAGTAAGAALPFDTAGIGFAMTALFVVIAVEQWRTVPTRIPLITGAVASIAMRAVFADNFILPAMAAIVIILILLRVPTERKLGRETREEEGACRTQDTR